MKTSDTLVTVLGAAAVGAILGVLFAPDKGTKTREKIAKKTLETKEQLEQNINELSSTVVDQYNTVKESGKELYTNKKEKLKDSVIKAAQNA